MEEWRNAFAQLQEAIGETEQLKESSVAQDIRERVSRRQSGQSVADSVRSVLEQKTIRVSESQERCWALAEREKLAFQEIKKCATASANRRYPSVNQHLKELGRERDKAIRDLKYVMTQEAYIQYLNQRPLTQDDYSFNQKAYSNSWYSSFKASR